MPELFGTNIMIDDFVGFLAGGIQWRNFPETEECSAINQNFILPHFCYSSSKIAIIPTNFIG